VILIGLVVLLVGEIWALTAVASHIGVLATLGLLLLGAVVGAWLLRREGTRAWQAFATAVAEGRPPGREVLDGMLVLVGGLLVMFPGFITDVLGLLCLLPPSRRLIGRGAVWYALRRGNASVIRVRSRRMPSQPPGAPGPRPAQRPGQGRVIEGEIERPPNGDR
jgi:UPF0716 protein FxsA